MPINKLKLFSSVVLASVVMATSSHATEKWDIYTYNSSPTVPAVQGLEAMSKKLEETTGGELKLRVHLGGSLPISGSNITQAVSDDIVQMGDDVFVTGSVPIAGLLWLPMLIQDMDEMETASEIVMPYVEKIFAERDIIILAEYIYPLSMPWSTKPLVSLEDLKDQKLRVNNAEQGEFVRRFGGTPITMTTAEVVTALDRNVIDGVFTATAGSGYLWRDLLQSNYRLGLSYAISYLTVNKDRFEGLSPEMQEQLRTAAVEAGGKITATLQEREEALTDELASGILDVTYPAEEEVGRATEVMSSYWESWAAERGDDAVKALADVRAALGR
ncbi:hypothetical protein B6V72_18340 [Thioclava sp. F34-6]|uniref:TRAP transporter substrate-binding protein DctP n=1 Tax=Thioclava sp. F34-6 TaxID=1973003 RepID=UPI000B53DE5E|nr:TRAP transporter substrate-binding protein DctP [Thioclava sp. F34-6]OWY08858.1 hypothetical protein B6V72_18340 [Thioclava sp. F34-6]